MSFSKSIPKILSLLLPFVVCSACSNESPEPIDGKKESKQLSITTSVFTRAIATTEFVRDDVISLFVKTEGSVSSNDYKSDVKATFDGTSWSINPKIDIEAQSKLYIYAAYPFKQNMVNAAAYPLNIEEQMDYLYSGSAVIVSYDTPNAALKMNHALAIMAFDIVLQDYDGNGNLESIAVEGEAFHTTGTINIGNGQIELGSVGKYTHQYGKNVTEKNDSPQFFVLPSKSNGNNIHLTFRIDGKNYGIDLPALVVSSGWKYVFHLALTPSGLHVFADKTETISLNNALTPTNPGQYATVQLTYSTSNINLPEIIGENLSGTVYWSQTEKSPYTYPLSHSYQSGESTHSISIDTWGAEQIVINDLEGLEEINLSRFR